MLQLLPSEAMDDGFIRQRIAMQESIKPRSLTGYSITKRSIDARSRQVYINLQVNAFIDEPFHKTDTYHFQFKEVQHAEKKVVIIGAGPAGLFAALQLMEAGIKPIILERGKDVRSRRRDLAILNKEGIINPESNYCFGEGGAGTYSDGKLYTRSSKRGDIARILQLFVFFGAEASILYDAHPHIGTNKLPQIITAMRQHIIRYGGEFYFEQKVTGLKIVDQKIQAVKTTKDIFEADECILATGHSARDIFIMLQEHGILIEAKPFALGVRIEHPQTLIDSIQYHAEKERDVLLPPASYSLVQQVDDRGVFSFCMCPGGIIAPASTDVQELVVNGWSPSKRNNPFANSGMVVQVHTEDAMLHTKSLGLKANDPLLMMHFQKMVEQHAYKAGGGKFVAPAQRMADFCDKKISTSLPTNSYLPGVLSSELQNVLPDFIYQSLSKSFRAFGKKMKGYYTNEAMVVATESRTSSPVRIPRHAETLQHPQIKNLYPCGEGAGYAGGIVSAAMDGERVASAIAIRLLRS